MSKPAKSSFSQYVVCGLLPSFDPDLCVCLLSRDAQYVLLLCLYNKQMEVLEFKLNVCTMVTVTRQFLQRADLPAL